MATSKRARNMLRDLLDVIDDDPATIDAEFDPVEIIQLICVVSEIAVLLCKLKPFEAAED